MYVKGSEENCKIDVNEMSGKNSVLNPTNERSTKNESKQLFRVKKGLEK